MTDAVQRALERSMRQNSAAGYPGVQGQDSAPHLMGGMEDDASIPLPGATTATVRQQDDTYLSFRPTAIAPIQRQSANAVTSSAQMISVDLTGVRAANLAPEQRDKLLDDLVTAQNEHTAERRELELERDKISVDNKRRFSSLGFYMAAAGGGIFLTAIVSILAVMLYGGITGKKTLEGSLLNSFLTSFMEVLKAVFSVSY